METVNVAKEEGSSHQNAISQNMFAQKLDSEMIIGAFIVIEKNVEIKCYSRISS